MAVTIGWMVGGLAGGMFLYESPPRVRESAMAAVSLLGYLYGTLLGMIGAVNLAYDSLLQLLRAIGTLRA